MATELIPIGTLLTVITKQVIKTANAAKDVVFEKESFLRFYRAISLTSNPF